MRLATEVRGEGEVVVLIHGFPLDGHLWSAAIEDLSRTYQVVVPDLPGHGLSGPPEGPMTMEALADSVVETIDGLGVSGPFFVGGMSMGGYVALAMLERYPERIRGLLLLNTRSAADTPEVRKGREETAQKVESTGSIEGLVDSMIPKLFSESTQREQPELVHAWRERMSRTSPAGVVGALRGMAARPDRTGLLQAYPGPALVVAGEVDSIVRLEESRAMAAALSHGRLEVLEGVGHMAPVEAPRQTVAALRSFLEATDQAVRG